MIIHRTVIEAAEHGPGWVTGFETVDGREVLCGVVRGDVKHIERWLPADVSVVGVIGKSGNKDMVHLEVVDGKARARRGNEDLQVEEVVTNNDLYMKDAMLVTTEVRTCFAPTSVKGWSILVTSDTTRHVCIDSTFKASTVQSAAHPTLQASIISRKGMVPDHVILSRLQSLFEAAPAGNLLYASCHFWPSQDLHPYAADFPPLLHPLTVTYSVQGDNTEVRKAVHNAFGLPSVPLLKPSQRVVIEEGRPLAYHLRHETRKGGLPLENVDIGLQPAENTSSARVRGLYEYYHYRCDGFRDEGWGCAYRSMQTILSWFKLNGYGEYKVPDIREIQEMLFKVDSSKRDVKFVGSKEWIGSTEIWLMLESLVDVRCTVQRIEKGSDLTTDRSVQQTLLNHFKINSTPVMIGGHQYAHTLLGISLTPTPQLLVLDPHYPSSQSSLTTIQSDGWCQWKPPSKVFKADCWYNICMPQLPARY